MPAVARTDSAKPGCTASPGCDQQQDDAPRPPAPGRRAVDRRLPIANSATVPIAAARSTLGSVRASSTNPTMPSAPTTQQPATAQPRPAGQHQQEPDHQGQVGAGDGQQVGETGRPEVVGERRVEAGVVAVDQRRHQRALVSGRCATASRIELRTAAAPRHHRSGPGDHLRRAPSTEHGGEVVTVGRPRAGPARAPCCPARRRASRRRPITSTGAPRAYVVPRPVTSRTSSRARTRSP